MDHSHSNSVTQYLLPDRKSVKVFARALLTAFLSLGVLAYSIIYYTDQRAEQSLLQSLKSEEEQAATAMLQTVQQTLMNTTASLQYLVSLIERSLPEAAPLESVARTLLSFSETHPSFDQLRYLDLDGREIVRIDSTSEGSRIVSPEDLQDKSSRDYFQGALKTARGKVLVIPVEFNRERGALEYPLKPVVRLAMPVFNAKDQKVGIAIINYKARSLLDRLFAIGQLAKGNPNILSFQGRWLMESNGYQPQDYHINPTDDRSFPSKMPREWALLGESVRGSFRTEKGLFSHRVLRPAAMGKTNASNPVSWTVPKRVSSDEGGWIVLSHIPEARLKSILASSHLLTTYFGQFAFWLMVLGVSWLVALQLSASHFRIEALQSTARSDSLTGLVNRGEFDRNLTRAISLAQRNKRAMGVVYVDVDEFKALNDTHGHATGDRVLMAVAERLAQCCRSSDVAARCGGDEFSVILSELSGRSDAAVAAKDIANRIRQPLYLDHGEYQISVSVGFAVYPDDGVSADELLKHADQAMYADKALSRQAANA